MSFGTPQMLIAVFLLPALAVAFLWIGARNRRVRLCAWAVPETANRLAPDVQPWGRTLRNALVCIGLACIGIALMRPQWGYHYEEVQRRGIDLALIVDVSESMRAEDVDPSRLERAKREILDFLDIIGGDRVALVAAAGTSFIQCPLTLDYGALRSFLSLVDTDLIPTPGTDLGAALQTAATALESSGATRARAIVLISDGGNLDGDPLAVARTLQEQDITIYTVGIGRPEAGVPIPLPEGGYKRYDDKVITTKLEEGTLKSIAREGKGVYVRAVSGDLDLDAIYQDIRSRNEMSDLGTSRRKVYHERFIWPLGLGLLCFALEICIPERSRRPAIALVCALAAIHPASGWADVTSEVNSGIAAYESGDFDKALEAFSAVREQAPSDARALLNHGAAHYKAGNAEEAAKLFTEAASLAANDALRAYSHYNAGNAFAQLRQFDKAATSYESSLRIDPSNADAKANLELVRKLIEEHEQQQQDRDEQQQQEEQERQDQQDEEGSDAGERERQENRQDSNNDTENTDTPSPQENQQSPQDNAGDPESQQNQDQPAEQEPPNGQQGAENAAQPSTEAEDPQESNSAETAPGAMTQEEADQWLHQLPDDEGEALKKFWQSQQPQPSGKKERDW